MTTKRQHYVPRFYLKLFANSKGKLNYFDKVLRKPIFNMHYDNVSHQRYFYDLSDEFI